MGRPRAAELVRSPSTTEPARRGQGRHEDARILPVVLPVAAAGALVLAAATWAISRTQPPPEMLAGVLALLAAAAIVEAVPVPLERAPVGRTSLATIFIVGAGIIYGWGAAVVVGFLAQLLVEVGRRRPLVPIAFNSSVYALAGAATAAGGPAAERESIPWIALAVLMAASAFYVVDVALVGAVVARSEARPLGSFLRGAFSSTVVPFAILISLAFMLVVLWRRSPFFAFVLIGPLAAIALYQRSVFEELRAMRLALTDPLTGLGNHRRFHERLASAVVEAERQGQPVALCLVDVDGFKELNDRRGHPAGDRLLEQVAALLRRSGEAFRIGGDEFALLLPRRTAGEALRTAETLTGTALTGPDGERVTVSTGVAAYPALGVEAEGLVRAADEALYQAKREGRGRARLYEPAVLDLLELPMLPGSDREARLRAAARLAHAADARDTAGASHAHVVADLAARLAEELGLGTDEAELVRLAGRVHDLGKLAIPEEILRKPDALDDDERRLVERHAEVGFRMLDSLGIEPVATWVLHHHERWDGGGYPAGLSGDRIPLGARILFVAEAYDAMTSERAYRPRLSHAEAAAEIARGAGSQFDPEVAAAFERLERDEVAALQASARLS